MSGYLGVGETDPQNGAEIGKRKGDRANYLSKMIYGTTKPNPQ